MRSGVCTLQQTLTAEAASVLKHSLNLARRRGHAQLTPLHVAATLLSFRASSFRRACLRSQPHQTTSHHHPLHSRALELCFNVALNRLPTAPSPLLHSQPSLSNALVAALKRAQAHQRRGCIEQNQQQPLLTVKVEIEQLIISILDDPSVSRVMREAGFSSTDVKNSIEDCSSATSVFQCYNNSGGVFSSPSSPSPPENQREAINLGPFRQNNFLAYNTTSEYNPVFFSPQKRVLLSGNPITDSGLYKEDIKLVLDILLRKNKKKNTVIVGDSVFITEGLVRELARMLERGEVPDELKSTRMIRFQIASASLRFMEKEEAEMKLLELKRKVDSIALGGGGVIVHIGDLKWAVDEPLGEKDGEISGYNPGDYLVAEIGRFFSEYESSNSNAKVWLMGTASYQTYMSCQKRQPPLEVKWGLQAVPVPSGGLGLSLHANSSVLDAKMNVSQDPSHMLEAKPFSNGDKEEQDKLTCCEECASNYEKEAHLFKPSHNKLLPSWLQSHAAEAYQKEELMQLRRKWNRLCHCLHQTRPFQNHWSTNLYSNQSSSKSWLPKQSIVFPDSNSLSFTSSAMKPIYGSNFVTPFPRQQAASTIEFNFSNGTQKQQATEPSLDSLKGMEMEGKEVKITLALGNSPFGDSGKTVENITDRSLRRARVCKMLQENVPWQSETIPSIAEALIGSKSAKQNTSWLFMLGNDCIGKQRMARAIAESVFGSADLIFHLDMAKKETSVAPCSEMLVRALKNHDKVVIFIENVDFADIQFNKFLADGYETGKFGALNMREDKPCQAIFILTNSDSTGIDVQNQDSVINMVLQISESKPSLEEPNVDHKRKAEWDLFTKTKNPRIEEKEEILLDSEQGNKKKDFSRQSSFNTLDLNIRADDDDVEEEKTGESSPISSDLTRETIIDSNNSNGLFGSIKNRFVLNRSPARDREMAELFLSKIKSSFEDIFGKHNLVNFSVESRVLEKVLVGCGYFTNTLFDKWLRENFQKNLRIVNFGGKEGIVFRLCCGDGKGDRIMDNGFMSSSLPKKIQVTYLMD